MGFLRPSVVLLWSLVGHAHAEVIIAGGDACGRVPIWQGFNYHFVALLAGTLQPGRGVVLGMD